MFVYLKEDVPIDVRVGNSRGAAAAILVYCLLADEPSRRYITIYTTYFKNLLALLCKKNKNKYA